MSRGLGRDAAKRALDVTASGAALILLSPVIAVTWALVRSRLGAPAVFRQERPGLGGRPFMMYKFRTMTDARDARGALLPDEQRLTPLGMFLRRTSLDELPQLLNVLTGRMNLVGPRPDVLPQVANYTADDRRRLEVKPGITGWAQVNGREDIDWAQRFVLDRWYVDHWSPALDLRILWRTATSLQRGEPPVHVDEINIQRRQAHDVRRAA